LHFEILGDDDNFLDDDKTYCRKTNDLKSEKDTYVPITIIDSNGMAKHEESITENIYLNGKKTKHKFIKRWENKNDKN
jgi:hypothetical protein